MKQGILTAPVILTTALLITGCNAEKKQIQPPNIIYIMSDDHAYQAISAYGYDLIQTPHIDRLAREGALFNQSFVTNSICAPSRAVMLTGQYSHVNGKVDNIKPFNWDQQNVAKVLQDAGYQTALVGKIHLDGLPQGFDYSIVLPGQGLYYNPVFIENGERKSFEGHTTTLTTEFALDWLENKRDKSKPFLLLYQQKAPHRNWLPEPRYLDLFEDREFEFPHNFFDDYQGRGTAAREQEMEIVRHMQWGGDMKFEYHPFTGEPQPRFKSNLEHMTDEQLAAWKAVYDPLNQAFIDSEPDEMDVAKFMFHRYLRDYLKCIKGIDDGVGEILEYLDKNGLSGNTIVVYTSDQGFYLGEHGWFDKRFMYEESFRTPLIIRYPPEIKPGSVIDEMVVNIDHFPAFLDYAGVDIPDDLQGMSYRKVVAGKKVPWRDAVYYHYYEYPSAHMVKRHYGVRTDRYKLIHFYYDIDEWEMYDLVDDPSEMRSVYNDPAYAEVQKKMHEKLEEVRERYGDSDEITRYYLDEYLKFWEARQAN